MLGRVEGLGEGQQDAFHRLEGHAHRARQVVGHRRDGARADLGHRRGRDLGLAEALHGGAVDLDPVTCVDGRGGRDEDSVGGRRVRVRRVVLHVEAAELCRVVVEVAGDDALGPDALAGEWGGGSFALDLGDLEARGRIAGRRRRHAVLAAVPWVRRDDVEVRRVVVRVGGTVRLAQCRGDAGQDRSRPGSLEEVGPAVTDQVGDPGRLGCVTRVRAAVACQPERRSGPHDDDLSGADCHVDGPGCVRRGEGSTNRSVAGLLDKVVPAGWQRAGQGDRAVGSEGTGPRRAGVLHRPAGEIHGRGAEVVDLDEVMGEGRVCVSAAAIDLADDDVRRGGTSGRRSAEGAKKAHQQGQEGRNGYQPNYGGGGSIHEARPALREGDAG